VQDRDSSATNLTASGVHDAAWLPVKRQFVTRLTHFLVTKTIRVGVTVA
jgi:hypothetical protein